MHKPVVITRTITNMKKQDFVETAEFSEQQILDMMNLGVTLKACVRAEYFPPLLKRRCIGLILGDVPPMYVPMCKLAVHQLGGMTVELDVSIETPEKLREAAMLISRVCDLVVVRCERHETLLTLAKYATVPVVNAGSQHSIPVQEIGDLITMFEHLPREKKLEACKAVFYGPATASCASALYVTSKIGMQFAQVVKEKDKELKPPQLKSAERNVKKSGGAYAVTDSAEEAFHNADFLYMDAPLAQKVPPEAEGVLRIDPNENIVAAYRTILTCMLYVNPAMREPLLIEKMKRMLAIKLQAIFGFGEANE